MKLPEIPTDNLYKFMALSGIVVLIASLFPSFHVHKLNMQMIELAGEKAILRIQLVWLVKDIDKSKQKGQELSKQIQQQIDKWQKKHKKVTKKAMEEMEDIHISISNLNTLTEEMSELREPLEKITIATFKVNFKQLEIYYLRRAIRNEGILILFGFLSGIALMFFGFWLWYKKLQAPLDKIITSQQTSKNNN